MTHPSANAIEYVNTTFCLENLLSSPNPENLVEIKQALILDIRFNVLTAFYEAKLCSNLCKNSKQFWSYLPPPPLFEPNVKSLKLYDAQILFLKSWLKLLAISIIVYSILRLPRPLTFPLPLCVFA